MTGDLFAAAVCSICQRPVTELGCTMPGDDVGAFCRAPKRIMFAIPEGTPVRRCSSCGAAICWVESARGKRMPLEAMAPHRGESHFARCPNARDHRRPR
jgi:hypothetical protein